MHRDRSTARCGTARARDTPVTARRRIEGKTWVRRPSPRTYDSHRRRSSCLMPARCRGGIYGPLVVRIPVVTRNHGARANVRIERISHRLSGTLRLRTLSRAKSTGAFAISRHGEFHGLENGRRVFDITQVAAELRAPGPFDSPSRRRVRCRVISTNVPPTTILSH